MSRYDQYRGWVIRRIGNTSDESSVMTHLVRQWAAMPPAQELLGRTNSQSILKADNQTEQDKNLFTFVKTSVRLIIREESNGQTVFIDNQSIRTGHSIMRMIKHIDFKQILK